MHTLAKFEVGDGGVVKDRGKGEGKLEAHLVVVLGGDFNFTEGRAREGQESKEF